MLQDGHGAPGVEGGVGGVGMADKAGEKKKGFCQLAYKLKLKKNQIQNVRRCMLL